MQINREGDYYELTDGESTIYINENSNICRAEVYSEISESFYYDIKAFFTVASGKNTPPCLDTWVNIDRGEDSRNV